MPHLDLLAIQQGSAPDSAWAAAKPVYGRPPPASPPKPPLQRYLPGLDGLRALAVLMVVLFHSTLGIAPGGFLGVEVFFVISGYIITRGLLAERESSGRIALGDFWLRRARRLLPALVLLLLGVAGYSLLFAPEEAAGLRHDIVAALTYLTNWDLIVAGEAYFDAWERPSLLRHLWSLAVEEQFYVAWPLLMAGGLALLRRRLTLALIVAGAAAAAIAMAVLYEPGSAVTRIYYGTDTRASGLLIGSALAFVWSARQSEARSGLRATARMSALTLLGLAGLAALAGFTFLADGTTPFLYQGGFALVGMATAALIVAATHERSPLTRALGTPLLRWAGLRSYGIYLWHWPVMALTRPGVDIPLDGVALFSLQIAITIALAEGSYRWVEQPIRDGAMGRAWRRLREWTQAPRWQRGAIAFASAGSAAALGVVVTFLALAQAPEEPPYFSLVRVHLVPTSEAPAAFTPDERASLDAPPATEATPSRPSPSPDVAESRLWPDPIARAIARTREATAASEQAASVQALTETFETGSLAIEPNNPEARADSDAQATAEEDVDGAAPMADGGATADIRVTAIGDSVMLGAAHELARQVTGIEVDAAVGRQVFQVIALLEERMQSGRLGEIVLLHIGNNGAFSAKQFDQIMEVAGPDRQVVFLTLKVARPWEAGNNEVITEGAQRYRQALLVDWREALKERPEVLWNDGIHLRPDQADFYVALLEPYINP